MNTVSPSLLTFAPMIDSEFCRLILRHHRVGFTEDRHIFGWASLVALARGGTLQIPLLRGLGRTSLAGPAALADYLETTCATSRQLYPTDSIERLLLDADLARFNGALADATAALGYFYLLPCRALMTNVFSRGLPAGEVRILPRVYPVLSGLFKLLLGLNADHARSAATVVRCIFDETDRRVRSGRRFLVGDRLTLSDLALASAAAPLLLPSGYGSPMPTLEEMPTPVNNLIKEFRERATYQFVTAIYEQVA